MLEASDERGNTSHRNEATPKQLLLLTTKDKRHATKDHGSGGNNLR